MDRKTYIGGSDIGAIIGVSKRRTPLDVYLEKIGERVDEPDERLAKIFRRGKRLEPVVLEMLLEEHRIETLVRNERYVDKEFQFFSCEIDAEAIDAEEHVNIEAKTSHPFARDQWGDEGTDQIDVSYAAQAMWGLGITGRRRCIFGVLVGSDTLLRYEVIRDEEIIKDMRARAAQFWNANVLPKIPPAPVNLADVMTLFRRRTTPTIVIATEEVSSWVAALIKTRQLKSTAEAREAELKFQIGKFALGEAGVYLGSKGETKPAPNLALGEHVLRSDAGADLFRIVVGEATRLDGEKLRREEPVVAEKFTKTSKTVKFDKPKKGK